MASNNLYLRSDSDKSETSPDNDLRLRSDEDKLPILAEILSTAIGILSSRKISISKQFSVTKGLVSTVYSKLVKFYKESNSVLIGLIPLDSKKIDFYRKIVTDIGFIASLFKDFSRTLKTSIGYILSISKKLAFNKIFNSTIGLISDLTKLNTYKIILTTMVGLFSDVVRATAYTLEKISSLALKAIINKISNFSVSKNTAIGLITNVSRAVFISLSNLTSLRIVTTIKKIFGKYSILDVKIGLISIASFFITFARKLTTYAGFTVAIVKKFSINKLLNAALGTFSNLNKGFSRIYKSLIGFISNIYKIALLQIVFSVAIGLKSYIKSSIGIMIDTIISLVSTINSQLRIFRANISNIGIISKTDALLQYIRNIISNEGFKATFISGVSRLLNSTIGFIASIDRNVFISRSFNVLLGLTSNISKLLSTGFSTTIGLISIFNRQILTKIIKSTSIGLRACIIRGNEACIRISIGLSVINDRLVHYIRRIGELRTFPYAFKFLFSNNRLIYIGLKSSMFKSLVKNIFTSLELTSTMIRKIFKKLFETVNIGLVSNIDRLIVYFRLLQDTIGTKPFVEKVFSILRSFITAIGLKVNIYRKTVLNLVLSTVLRLKSLTTYSTLRSLIFTVSEGLVSNISRTINISIEFISIMGLAAKIVYGTTFNRFVDTSFILLSNIRSSIGYKIFINTALGLVSIISYLLNITRAFATKLGGLLSITKNVSIILLVTEGFISTVSKLVQLIKIFTGKIGSVSIIIKRYSARITISTALGLTSYVSRLFTHLGYRVLLFIRSVYRSIFVKSGSELVFTNSEYTTSFVDSNNNLEFIKQDIDINFDEVYRNIDFVNTHNKLIFVEGSNSMRFFI